VAPGRDRVGGSPSGEAHRDLSEVGDARDGGIDPVGPCPVPAPSTLPNALGDPGGVGECVGRFPRPDVGFVCVVEMVRRPDVSVLDRT
jgi:hypothetical protein